MAYPTHGPEYHERLGWIAPCRAATTATITIATALNAADTLDGVTLAAGDRVLVKDQSTASQNGIYIVGASPSRAGDYAASGDIVGSVVMVVEGTANALTAWKQESPAPIVVGTTALVFSAFGTGGGGSLTVENEDTSSPTAGSVLRVAKFTDNGGGDLSLLPQILGAGTGTIEFVAGTETIIISNSIGSVRLDASTGYVRMMSTGGDAGVLVDGPNKTASLWGGHTAGALAGKGVNIEVGEDFVGFYISEKDSATIQLYDDSGGSYDFEFVEQAAGRHFKFIHASGGVAIPALGIPPIYAAAPHSGTETEGETYYDSTLHKARTYDGTTWQNHW